MHIDEIYKSIGSLFDKKKDIHQELKAQKAELIEMAKELKQQQKKSDDKQEKEEIKSKRKIVKKMIDKIQKSLKES